MFLYTLKSGSGDKLKAKYISKSGSEDKLKAKTPDVYYNRSHMECYNFCQQCKDHFATSRATGPIWIPFAAFFLQDRINFR